MKHHHDQVLDDSYADSVYRKYHCISARACCQNQNATISEMIYRRCSYVCETDSGLEIVASYTVLEVNNSILYEDNYTEKIYKFTHNKVYIFFLL